MAGEIRVPNFFAEYQQGFNAARAPQIEGERNALLRAQMDTQRNRLAFDQAQAQQQTQSGADMEAKRAAYGELVGRYQSAPDDATRQQLYPMLTKAAAVVGERPPEPFRAPVPFEQTDDYRKLQMQQTGAADLERQRAANARALEALRQRGATTKPPAAAERKMEQAAALNIAKIDGIERRLTRLDSALNKIERLPLVDTGPLDQFAVGKLPVGQEVSAAAESIRPLLTALTRVPGVGSQSDLEARLDALQYPSIDKAPEVNRNTMKELREFISDLRAAYRNAGQGTAAGAESPADSGGDIVVDW